MSRHKNAGHGRVLRLPVLGRQSYSVLGSDARLVWPNWLAAGQRETLSEKLGGWYLKNDI